MEYIDKSIAITKTFSNVFLKARILHKKGEVKEAIKLAEEEKNEGWVNYIQENLDTWKEK